MATHPYHLCILIFITAFVQILAHRNDSTSYLNDLRKNKIVSVKDSFPDRNFVLDMMQLSADIFEVKNNLPEEAISNPKFEVKLWINAKFSTEAMIVTSKEENSTAFVIFKGSDNFDDWLVNINIKLEKSKFTNAPVSVEVHRGFQDALFDQDIVGEIEDKVLELVGEDGKVIFTGHSLGAANAHMTGTYLADRHPNLKTSVINFGSPRIGNSAFKSWTETTLKNLSVWRFVFRRDIVPRIILRQLGYVHAGHLFMMYENNSKVYYHQVGNGWNYKGAPLSWYFASSYKEHPHPMYLNFIKEIISLDEYWPVQFEKWFFIELFGFMRRLL